METPQKRRRERLRRHIIAVAYELFLANGGEDGGLEATTAEMIAERADISERTFFRYFESKLDAIFLDYRQASEELLGLVESRLADEAAERALVNGALDHLRAFESLEANRERLALALRSPPFVERRAIGLLSTRRRLIDMVQPRLEDQTGLRARILVDLVRGAAENALEEWAAHAQSDLPTLFLAQLTTAPAIAASLQTSPQVAGDGGKPGPTKPETRR